MVDPLDRFRSGKHMCKPFRYKRSQRKPKQKPDKTIILGLACAHRTPPALHPRVFELTGRYESDDQRLTVCVNQGGNFIAVWVSKVSEDTALHYLGYGAEPSFNLVAPDSIEESVGWVGPGDGKTHDLVIQLDAKPSNRAKPWKLIRHSERPTLSDRALAHLGTSEEAQIARRLEHSPLLHSKTAELTKMLTSKEFEERLENFFAQEIELHGMSLSLVKAGNELNAFLGTQRKEIDPGSTAKRIADYQRHILNILRTRSWKSSRAVNIGPNKGASSTRPLYDWLMEVVAIRSSPPFTTSPPYGYNTENLHESFLNLPRITGDMPFEYEFELQQTGIAGDLGIGISAFKGDLRIRQTKPSRQETPWSYVTMAIGFSLGWSAGATLIKEAKGVGRSHSAWTEVDFLGRINMFEGGGTVAPGGGVSKGTTTWRIRSAAGGSVMTVDFGDAAVIGLTAGAEVGEGTGYIRQDEDSLRETVVKAHSIEWVGYQARYRGKDEAHFDLGSATLTPQAIQTLGYMAASELSAFKIESSKLMVIGTADRVDEAWYNKLLSGYRAENVAQVFKDCLGDDLKAMVDTYGLGESPAEHAGDPDGKENPKFRRVLITLNGHAIARLQVARP